jgi:hypothetical protein
LTTLLEHALVSEKLRTFDNDCHRHTSGHSSIGMVAIYPPRVHDALIVRIACFVRFHVVHLRLIACVRFVTRNFSERLIQARAGSGK